MKQSEKTIERYLSKAVKLLGGLAVKGNTVNSKGYPDRVIHLPGGLIGFLELKSEGKKPRKLQSHWLTLLSDMGFKTGFADTKEKVDKFLRELLNA